MASKRAYLREVNPHLTCPLCRGYLIDATTVVECLHSFCRSCILKHLRQNAQCPSCKQLLNTAKPNIKADKTLQEIVYKLVPNLYHTEMKKRREFYSKNPEYGFAASLYYHGGAESATPEQRGEDVTGRLIFAPSDVISLSLEYLPNGVDPASLPADVKQQHHQPDDNGDATTASRRYLNCPALVLVAYLKKFLALKYNIDVTRYNIDICHKNGALPEDWTLMDVAYIFAWKRNDPMRFFYRITQEEHRLEAPSDVRPSTPGLGASQPATAEPETPEPPAEKPVIIKKLTDKQLKPFVALERSTSEMLAKRSSPTKLSSKTENQESLKVKSPLKIMKKPDGRYKVLSNTASEMAKTAEFSVVSIGDGANSNGVKITLKQCSPGTNSSNLTKKPKVISNVLLNKGNTFDDYQMRKEKHKRKQVSFEKRKSTENPDKKQFLQGFSLTSKHSQSKEPSVKDNSVEAQVKEIIKNKQLALQKANEEEAKKKQQQEQPQQQQKEPPKQKQSEQQQKEPPKQKQSQQQQKETPKQKQSQQQQKETPKQKQSQQEPQKQKQPQQQQQTPPPAQPEAKKKQPTPQTLETKTSSTNIADRLSDAKQSVKEEKPQPSTEAQQPVDVYTFPGDPPAPVVPAGAVKRKCPPGLPISELRKQQQQQQPQVTKKSNVSTSKNPSVKCYKNQSTKQPTLYPKPPPSPARNAPSPVAKTSTPPPTPPTSSSTPVKPEVSPYMSDDTRTLLDGCGLNIPASLSITLTAPKSPSVGAEQSPISIRAVKEVARQNPSITLNDKSVDTKVLKALKTGQMRTPAGPSKTKGKHQMQSPDTAGPPAKKKKEEMLPTMLPQSPLPQSILDLSGSKRMDVPLKIPIPVGKPKTKPPNWTQPIFPKPSLKDDWTSGPVVTLPNGQRVYRAPPGSLTPAANRFTDMPSPSRTPVYASCFSPGPSAQFTTSPFPALKNHLYLLNQAPTFEQFAMESRLRMAALAPSPIKSISPAIPVSSTSVPMGKSHLAAQCAPIKPARSSAGSFAVPLAKQPSIKPAPILPSPAPSNAKKSNPVPKADTSSSTVTSKSTSSESKEKKQPETPKEAPPPNSNVEQSEKIASTTEDGNSQPGSASPRVTSTVSPSPPPTASNEQDGPEKSSASTTESDKGQSTSGSEVTSTNNKSPESPDSSSVVSDSTGNLVDSTKPAEEKSKDTQQPKNDDTKSSPEKEKKDDTKADIKEKTEEFKKPMTPEALQKRFLAAFPSTEWANNPVAAEQFGNFLKSLSSAQAEAQSKTTKVTEK